MSRRALVVHASNLLERGFLSNIHRSPLTSGQSDQRACTRSPVRSTVVSRSRSPNSRSRLSTKADSDKNWSPDLQEQASKMTEILVAHGFPILVSPNPADLVAALTASARVAGCDVVVIGSDKRLAQLVADDVWWYDPYKDVRYTPELVRKRFGRRPRGCRRVASNGWRRRHPSRDQRPWEKGRDWPCQRSWIGRGSD